MQRFFCTKLVGFILQIIEISQKEPAFQNDNYSKYTLTTKNEITKIVCFNTAGEVPL